MMSFKSWEAFTPVSTKPVRTFNYRDLAERYRENMKSLGTEITIKVSRVDRRAM